MARLGGLGDLNQDGEYIIFSVFQAGLVQKLNIDNHVKIREFLEDNNIPHKVLVGYYKENHELSFIVPYKHYDVIAQIAFDDFEQESILYIKNYFNGLYKSWSIDSCGFPIFLGYLRSVPEKVALRKEAYSYDSLQNKYFIITPENTCDCEDLERLGYK